MNSLTSKTLQWTSSDTAARVECAFFVRFFFTSLFSLHTHQGSTAARDVPLNCQQTSTRYWKKEPITIHCKKK